MYRQHLDQKCRPFLSPQTKSVQKPRAFICSTCHNTGLFWNIFPILWVFGHTYMSGILIRQRDILSETDNKDAQRDLKDCIGG